MNEMFPPSEDELLHIIKSLKEMLENHFFQEQWKELSEELKMRESQLNALDSDNNTL